MSERAAAGPAAVRCRGCGYDDDGELELVDVYEQERPPGPRGAGDWLAVYSGSSEGRSLSECPRCGEDWLGIQAHSSVSEDALVAADEGCARCGKIADRVLARLPYCEPCEEVVLAWHDRSGETSTP